MNKRNNNFSIDKASDLYRISFPQNYNDIYNIDFKNIYDIITIEKNITIGQFIVIKKITKSKLRSFIGKWYPPSGGQLSINNAIDDMYFRIINRIEGRYDYFTGKSADSQKGGRYVYTLIIKEEKVLFINDNRGICYIIVI